MEEAFTYLRTYEFWIYGILCLGMLLYVRKFLLAWQELRGAAFGLEKNNAQTRLNQAASMLVLLLTIAITVFILVSFIAPSIPGANSLFTPTVIESLPTAISVSEAGSPETTALATVEEIVPTDAENGCVPGKVEISSPISGNEVKDRVSVMGTVDIENFGFYKLESKRPDEPTWVIILAGNQPVKNGDLGTWDTRRLLPGEYQLSVVPVDNAANSLPRCTVLVRVAAPSIETEPPPLAINLPEGDIHLILP
jgi:hypothetical protein